MLDSRDESLIGFVQQSRFDPVFYNNDLSFAIERNQGGFDGFDQELWPIVGGNDDRDYYLRCLHCRND